MPRAPGGIKQRWPQATQRTRSLGNDTTSAPGVVRASSASTSDCWAAFLVLAAMLQAYSAAGWKDVAEGGRSRRPHARGSGRGNAGGGQVGEDVEVKVKAVIPKHEALRPRLARTRRSECELRPNC